MTRSDTLAAALDRLQDEYPTAWVPLHGSSKARVVFPLSDVDETPADLRGEDELSIAPYLSWHGGHHKWTLSKQKLLNHIT